MHGACIKIKENKKIVVTNVKEGVPSGMALLIQRMSSFLHLKKEVKLVFRSCVAVFMFFIFVSDFFGCLRVFDFFSVDITSFGLDESGYLKSLFRNADCWRSSMLLKYMKFCPQFLQIYVF